MVQTLSDSKSGDFGSSVSISQDRALVGSPSNPGNAELFRRESSGTWISEQIFTSPGSSQLGTSVSIDGDTLDEKLRILLGMPCARRGARVKRGDRFQHGYPQNARSVA